MSNDELLGGEGFVGIYRLKLIFAFESNAYINTFYCLFTNSD